MVCKDYFNNMKKEDILVYINKSIDKLFACLKIYEDIESGKSTNSQLSTYIKILILEFQGFGNLYEPQIFIALISTLNGIEENLSTITHMQMKSYIFYCIDTVKKCRCDYL